MKGRKVRKSFGRSGSLGWDFHVFSKEGLSQLSLIENSVFLALMASPPQSCWWPDVPSSNPSCPTASTPAPTPLLEGKASHQASRTRGAAGARTIDTLPTKTPPCGYEWKHLY